MGLHPKKNQSLITIFETHHYYSRNYATVIATLQQFEIHHYVHLERYWAHCQAYRGVLYIHMDTITPYYSFLDSLTHGADLSVSPVDGEFPST
jgi:hypothetical protein